MTGIVQYDLIIGKVSGESSDWVERKMRHLKVASSFLAWFRVSTEKWRVHESRQLRKGNGRIGCDHGQQTTKLGSEQFHQLWSDDLGLVAQTSGQGIIEVVALP